MTSTIPHQALYRRWRAQTFAEIVGQEAVVETLRNAVRSNRVGHAILFVGPRGTGKTSLARILAKAVNCTDLRDGDACNACSSCVSIREGTTLDLIEIDAATNNGIDEVRRLRERLPYPPGELKRKVYILDEAHQITGPAWNALLKSLEEPPEFVVFMFASTEPSRFPPAILSRLQRYDVRRLTVPEIEGKLTRILAADSREADDGAVHLIARLAAGGMRDAESMLDQLLSAAPERINEASVRDLLGLADAEMVDDVRGPPRPRRCGSRRRPARLARRARTRRPGAARSGRRRDPARARRRAGRTQRRSARSGRARRRRSPDCRDRPEPGRLRRAPLPAGAGPVRCDRQRRKHPRGRVAGRRQPVGRGHPRRSPPGPPTPTPSDRAARASPDAAAPTAAAAPTTGGQGQPQRRQARSLPRRPNPNRPCRCPRSPGPAASIVRARRRPAPGRTASPDLERLTDGWSRGRGVGRAGHARDHQ